MNLLHPRLALPFLGLLLALTHLAGCGRNEAPGMDSMEAAMAPAPMVADTLARAPQTKEAGEAQPGDATPRYLAERQFWVFELPEAQIESRWQAHMALCRADCEVLQAALEKSNRAPVSAHLEIRVGRASADRMLKAMSSPELTEHRVEREDKTLQVVDVEARIKNQMELRDRLRELLAKRQGSLKEILETERELARVQGDLDALSAQRKVLANETEKISLYVDYRPAPVIGQTGAMRPLAEAWSQAGNALADSLGTALLFIVRALPWVFIVLPAFWGAWKLLRRFTSWRQHRPDARNR
jgi:hypothetical protein